MAEQDTLVQRFQNSQAALEAAVAGLDEDAAAQVWYGRWGVKQIVAHIAGWQSAIAEALGRIARGERPSADGINLSDVEGTNDDFAARAEGTSFAAVLGDLHASAGRLGDAVRALPADRLEEGRTARRMVETIIGHPDEHIAAIREWRASSTGR